jgi:cupin fold WbuC family metalloprotein
MTGLSSIEFLNALAVDDSLVRRLKRMPFSITGTRRICLHKSEASSLHVMLVESEAGKNFPGHFHNDSDEVTIAVRGCLEMLVWDKGDHVTPTRICLGSDPDQTRIAFVPRYITHATKAVADNCVYLEVKLGPFQKAALVQVDETTLTSLDGQ